MLGMLMAKIKRGKEELDVEGEKWRVWTIYNNEDMGTTAR